MANPTTYMSMSIPVVSPATAGPLWGVQLTNSLQTIDAHDHITSGKPLSASAVPSLSSAFYAVVPSSGTGTFSTLTGTTITGVLVQVTTGSFFSLTASVLPTSGSATRSLNDVAYGALAYDMVFSLPGTPSGTLAWIVLSRPVTIPINASGSIGAVGTNPATASALLQIQRNGTPVITASIDATGTVTFVNTASINFVRGDKIKVSYTGSDPSLADVAITLVGSL